MCVISTLIEIIRSCVFAILVFLPTKSLYVEDSSIKKMEEARILESPPEGKQCKRVAQLRTPTLDQEWI